MQEKSNSGKWDEVQHHLNESTEQEPQIIIPENKPPKFKPTTEEVLESISRGDMSIIRRCVEEKIEVNYYDYYTSFSALMEVLLKGEEELALQMIELGGDIYHCDDYDCLSVPECAARTGCAEVVRLCIRKDALAYPDYTLFEGVKYPEIVKMLLAEGADPLFMNYKGKTVLMQASKYGVTESVRLLLDAGADIRERTPEGYTALMYAAASGNIDTIELLLNAGANLHDKDKKGKTALHFATDMPTAQYLQTMLDLQDSGY